MKQQLNRRHSLMLLGGFLILPGTAFAQTQADGSIRVDHNSTHKRNVSGFRTHTWQDHFQNTNKGAILCDISSRALHFWNAQGDLEHVFPCSVPRSQEFERRGHTHITLKRASPTWVPTPSMRERDPSLPQSVPPGPQNPLGTRALNLSWTHYRIHGIDDPNKIGRPASSGCFGLFNHHVEILFEKVEIGTQVRVI